MAAPGVVQAFFSQQTQRFAHAEVHVHRGGVVIHPIASPVLVEQGDIEVPVGHLAAAGSQLGLSPRTHGEGAEAGGAAEPLLAAAVGQIHLPGVEQQRHRPQRGDGVQQQQAVVPAAELADALHRLADAGGGFGMDHRQDGRLVIDQGLLQLLETEGLAPGALDRHHIGPVTTGHIHQALAEIAHHRHQHLVAGFDGVGQRGLHGGTAGAAHRNREPVIGLPGVAQQLLHFAHQLDVEGIEMADRRPGEGLEHLGMGVGGTWTEQQTFGSGDRIQQEPMAGIERRLHGKNQDRSGGG